jgi:hypothetical protein
MLLLPEVIVVVAAAIAILIVGIIYCNDAK